MPEAEWSDSRFMGRNIQECPVFCLQNAKFHCRDVKFCIRIGKVKLQMAKMWWRGTVCHVFPTAFRHMTDAYRSGWFLQVEKAAVTEVTGSMSWPFAEIFFNDLLTTSGFAASARRSVASRLWLCIFNIIGKQSLRDCDLTTVASRLWLYIFNKMG